MDVFVKWDDGTQNIVSSRSLLSAKVGRMKNRNKLDLRIGERVKWKWGKKKLFGEISFIDETTANEHLDEILGEQESIPNVFEENTEKDLSENVVLSESFDISECGEIKVENASGGESVETNFSIVVSEPFTLTEEFTLSLAESDSEGTKQLNEKSPNKENAIKKPGLKDFEATYSPSLEVYSLQDKVESEPVEKNFTRTKNKENKNEKEGNEYKIAVSEIKSTDTFIKPCLVLVEDNVAKYMNPTDIYKVTENEEANTPDPETNINPIIENLYPLTLANIHTINTKKRKKSRNIYEINENGRNSKSYLGTNKRIKKIKPDFNKSNKSAEQRSKLPKKINQTTENVCDNHSPSSVHSTTSLTEHPKKDIMANSYESNDELLIKSYSEPSNEEIIPRMNNANSKTPPRSSTISTKNKDESGLFTDSCEVDEDETPIKSNGEINKVKTNNNSNNKVKSKITDDNLFVRKKRLHNKEIMASLWHIKGDYRVTRQGRIKKPEIFIDKRNQNDEESSSNLESMSIATPTPAHTVDSSVNGSSSSSIVNDENIKIKYPNPLKALTTKEFINENFLKLIKNNPPKLQSENKPPKKSISPKPSSVSPTRSKTGKCIKLLTAKEFITTSVLKLVSKTKLESHKLIEENYQSSTADENESQEPLARESVVENNESSSIDGNEPHNTEVQDSCASEPSIPTNKFEVRTPSLEECLDGAPPFIREVFKCDNIKDGFINTDLIFVLSLLPDIDEMSSSQKINFQLKVIEIMNDILNDPKLRSKNNYP